jgi:hypothetical protein
MDQKRSAGQLYNSTQGVFWQAVWRQRVHFTGNARKAIFRRHPTYHQIEGRNEKQTDACDRQDPFEEKRTHRLGHPSAEVLIPNRAFTSSKSGQLCLNLLGGLASHCLRPNKPSIRLGKIGIKMLESMSI